MNCCTIWLEHKNYACTDCLMVTSAPKRDKKEERERNDIKGENILIVQYIVNYELLSIDIKQGFYQHCIYTEQFSIHIV